MTSIAAIDVGSNAVRLAVGFCDPGGKLSITAEQREAVRLGGDVFRSGEISEPTIALAELAFRKFKTCLETNHVQHIRAVGTSALREAKNRELFLRRIFEASGIRIEVISGDEEARLIHLAVSKAVNLDQRLALLVDIGGGSVEITLVRRGDVIHSDSVKMGAVRLLQLLDGRKASQKIFDRLVRSYVKGLRRRLKKDLNQRSVDICIGTGGNFEELGELRCKLFKKRDKKEILLKELSKIIESLSGLSIEERIQDLGLRPDRADVVLPAAILTQEIMRQSKVKRAIIPGVGLKNGLLWDLARAYKKNSSPAAQRRQALTFAHELGKRFSFDEQHAVTVAQFATRLFDELASSNKLTSHERLLLEVAALLHDIGHYINSNGHHKHSYYLIRASSFIGLSSEDKEIVACIARYHRKSPPKLENPEFAALGEKQRILVKKLAGILRIADAMDASHQNCVRSFSVKVGRSEIDIKLRGQGDLLLERWSIGNKDQLFKEAFGLEVRLAE